MAAVLLTDEQVLDLVLQLPTESKRLVLDALKAEIEPLNEPEIVDKQGILVVRASLIHDISDVLEREREARISAMTAGI